MPVNATAALFKTFNYLFMRGSLRRGDVNDVFYDAVVAREGRYGCTQRPIKVNLRVVMASRERAVLGLASRAVEPG